MYTIVNSRYGLRNRRPGYCINDLDKLIVIRHWILLKSGCVIHNEPEKEIITWNMAPDKTMISNYYWKGIQFKATFGPHEDLYGVQFKRDNYQVMFPLIIHTDVHKDLEQNIQDFQNTFKRAFTSFMNECKATDSSYTMEEEKDIN